MKKYYKPEMNSSSAPRILTSISNDVLFDKVKDAYNQMGECKCSRDKFIGRRASFTVVILEIVKEFPDTEMVGPGFAIILDYMSSLDKSEQV